MWNSDVAVAGTTITVNGNAVDITDKVGTSFADVVIETARNASMGKFRVILGGSEIDPADAPEDIEAGMRIELRPYDVAG